jgi:diguanylate cyclase
MSNPLPVTDCATPPPAHISESAGRVTDWRAFLVHAFFGADPLCHEHISRLLRSVWLTGVACALMGFSAWLGYTPVWATTVTVGYCSLVAVGLYALMRSGVARHWHTQTLTQVQLLVSISAVVVSYGVSDIARGAALQLLCLLLAFEMDRLSQRQLIKASAFAMVLLCLTLVARMLLWPKQVHLSVEIYDLVMSAVLLPVAIVVGGEVSRIYGSLLRQRELLTGTLEQLSALSARDALTGVANRRHAISLLEQEHKRQQRSGAALFVALLDIDWFKRINDCHGHGVGDRVLQRFASLCAAALPSDVTLARWGGEEFLLIMPASDTTRAMAVVAELRQQVAAEPWADLASGLRLSFSAGVAGHHTASTWAQTLERADRALYNAKDLGRDRTVTDGQPPDPAKRPVDDTAGPAFADGASGLGQAPAHAAPASLQHAAPVVAAAEMAFTATTAEGAITLFEPEHAPTSTPATHWRDSAGRLWRRIGDVVMGTDATRREHLRLPLMALPVHFFWVAAVIWFALPAKHIGTAQGWLAVMFELGCVVVFYGLIRSGLSTRWRDPSLVLAQMLAAMTVATFGYVMAPTLRASLLHLMCVILVFGMVTLRTVASRTAGIYSVVLMAVAALSIWWVNPADAARETIKLCLAGFVLARLAMLSQSYSRVRRDVSVEQKQLSRAVAQVQELVIRDALTGLFNRKHMQDVLAREHERFNRTGQSYAVALLDVDHFKKINDVHGHQVGDEVLCALAQQAQACLRQTDVLARWGGEEFLVVMPGIDHAHDGLAALARLRQALADHSWPQAANSADGASPPMLVSFSAGLARVRVGESIDQLIDRADRVLYDAKAGGRNRDVLADGHDNAPVGGIMRSSSGTAMTV